MRLRSWFKIALTWLLLVSCAWAEGLPVNIYYSLPAPHAKVLESFIAEYQASHTYLNIQTKNFAAPEELYAALNTGQTPTFALLDPTWLPDVVQKQPAFLPVDVWMPKEQFALNWAVKCNCAIPLWNACTMGDKLMAMPFFYTTKALIFNTENLAKAKVKALPATWEQLAKIAEKMVDPKAPTGLVPLALSVQGTSEQNARTLQILAWQSGADGISAPGPASDEAAQKASDLVFSWKKFLAPLEGPATPASSVAMFIGTMDDYFTLKAQGLPVKTALLPGMDKKTRGGEVQAWAWGMFKTFPDNQMYKIQELAFYLFDFPQQLRWAEQTPYLAAHIKVFDNPFYRQERLADHVNLRVFLSSLAAAKMVPQTATNVLTYRAIGKKLEGRFRGDAPDPTTTNTTTTPTP